MKEIELPQVTKVHIPTELDFRNSKEITNLVRLLVLEHAAIKPNYLGSILFGSVAHGNANNRSDIDLLHIAKNPSWDSIRDLCTRLDFIGDLYNPRVRVDQIIKPLDIHDLRAGKIAYGFVVDSQSQFLIPDDKIRAEVEFIFACRSNTPFVRPNPKPDTSLNTPPRQLDLVYVERIRQSSVFPPSG